MKQLRVLVVDDSLVMRKLVKQEIEKLGHEVVAMAQNGKEAVERFRELTPHVVTMDVTMPEMDGIEATRIIKEEYPAAKIIMVTSHEQGDIIKSAIDMGAMGYIVKPIDPATLRDNLNMVSKFL